MMGQRGEAWVILQGVLFVLYAIAPHTSPVWSYSPIVQALGWTLAFAAVAFFARSILNLGKALTPFPRPVAQGKLVTTGAYGVVRHPIYCAVIVGALGLGLITESWLRLGMVIVLFAFFDLKARREERWLEEKYPEYGTYQRRVKKLIPGVY